ncbi:putative T complex chaperonin, partial [Toxoplasma gondii TgCatPRC2]
EPLAHRIST